MDNRAELLQNFIVAARALAGEGMSGLNVEKAVLVAGAINSGADVVLVYNTSSEMVVGALHLPNPDSDPVELFRIEPEEVSH